MLLRWCLLWLVRARLTGGECLLKSGILGPACPTAFRYGGSHLMEAPARIGELCLMDGGCGTLWACDQDPDLCCIGAKCNVVNCLDTNYATKPCLKTKGCGLENDAPSGCYNGTGTACHSDRCNRCTDKGCWVDCLEGSGSTIPCPRAKGCALSLGGCGREPTVKERTVAEDQCYEDNCNGCDPSKEECINCIRMDKTSVSCPLINGCTMDSYPLGCFQPKKSVNPRRCFTDGCNDCTLSNTCTWISCLERDGSTTKCLAWLGCSTYPVQDGCGKGGTSGACFNDTCNADTSRRGCPAEFHNTKLGKSACCRQSPDNCRTGKSYCDPCLPQGIDETCKRNLWFGHSPAECNPGASETAKKEKEKRPADVHHLGSSETKEKASRKSPAKAAKGGAAANGLAPLGLAPLALLLHLIP